MKYYLQNSSAIEYVDMLDIFEEDSSILLIKAKSRRDVIDLNGIIQSVKNEEVPTLKITSSLNDLQIRLELFERSDYITLFRWMTDYKFITREEGSMLYKAQCERLAVYNNQSKSPFSKISVVSEAVTQSSVPQPTLNPL